MAVHDDVTAPQPLVGGTLVPGPRVSPDSTPPDSTPTDSTPVDSAPVDGSPDDGPAEPADEDRLTRLEHRVRQLELLAWGDGDDLAELDVRDPELTTLAKAAEHAQTLVRMLAPPPVRAACEHAIEARQEWQRRYVEAREAALAASRTLATTRADQDRHRQAALEFETARAQLDALVPERQRVGNAAEHARQQLAHDRQIRDQYAQEITEGHRAWVSLTTRLRLRMASAIERGEPLPIWLVDSLGPPPSADPSAWRELAVQLLAYRLSYAVRDPEHPLGAEPTMRDSPRRRQWHRDLDRELTGWRQRYGADAPR